jgi:hypothetical protein
MRLYNYQDRLELKILIWFTTCLLVGAFIALLTMDPQDENVYRNRNRIRTTRVNRRRIEEQEKIVEYDY